MRKKIKWILLSLMVPIVIIFGYYGYSIIQFGINIQKKSPQTAAPPNENVNAGPGATPVEYKPPVYEAPEWEGKERVNILLLGGDGRDADDSGRSDTTLVVSIDPVSKQSHIFSILRDTYTDIPDHGKNKINAALAFGGPELAMKAVGNFMGLPIHYYFYLDLESFIKLVDVVGGVDLEVEKDMKYTDTQDKEEFQIDLKKGMQHLDGNKALQYVRFRHDALSDFTRTERQRKFLKALAEKMQTTSSLIHLPGILKEMEPYMDTNMDLGDMVKLATLGYKIRAQTVETVQLPPMELVREEMINGSSVLTVNKNKLLKYVENQLSPDDENDVNSDRTNSIDNSTDSNNSNNSNSNSNNSNNGYNSYNSNNSNMSGNTYYRGNSSSSNISESSNSSNSDIKNNSSSSIRQKE
ncbi:LCP family protein [Paenibacillus eucommiae]|uniref:LCP family protein required for cell wall assembly n=1 Tax=Paenibacillus eucommiae TaxID=1355755 RepID=A0ABS4IUV1_9BACL|nr:LCP family protein [Paenibacillus eucommiae]MBP1990865.1 LCP family protein required for cell wall assembly [Paenibacillus eucommiae]